MRFELPAGGRIAMNDLTGVLLRGTLVKHIKVYAIFLLFVDTRMSGSLFPSGTLPFRHFQRLHECVHSLQSPCFCGVSIVQLLTRSLSLC